MEETKALILLALMCAAGSLIIALAMLPSLFSLIFFMLTVGLIYGSYIDYRDLKKGENDP